MNVYYNEIESFPCQVIEANISRGRLPAGRVHCADIRTVEPDELRDYRQLHLFAGIGVAAWACVLARIPYWFSICTFGFPCQDISTAGKGAGLDGAKSGLFFEAIRIVKAIRPTWLLIENVPGLRTLGIDIVIAELEAAGYCVLPPIVVGAWAIGAPQKRDRVWIVARRADTAFLELADADGHGFGGISGQAGYWQSRAQQWAYPDGKGYGVADPESGRWGVIRSSPGHSGHSNERHQALDDSTLSRTRPVSEGQGQTGHGKADAYGPSEELANGPSCHDARSIVNGNQTGEASRQVGECRRDSKLAHSNGARHGELGRPVTVGPELNTAAFSGIEFRAQLADSDKRRCRESPMVCAGETFPDEYGHQWPARPGQPQCDWEQPRTVEPPVGGAVDGIALGLVRHIAGKYFWTDDKAQEWWEKNKLKMPNRLRREALRGLGNAWVPQVAVPILRWIYETEMNLWSTE